MSIPELLYLVLVSAPVCRALQFPGAKPGPQDATKGNLPGFKSVLLDRVCFDSHLNCIAFKDQEGTNTQGDKMVHSLTSTGWAGGTQESSVEGLSTSPSLRWWHTHRAGGAGRGCINKIKAKLHALLGQRCQD